LSLSQTRWFCILAGLYCLGENLKQNSDFRLRTSMSSRQKLVQKQTLVVVFWVGGAEVYWLELRIVEVFVQKFQSIPSACSSLSSILSRTS
jgi:hypothetical protein